MDRAEPPIAVSVQEMYANGPLTEDQIHALLDQSLHPRGPQMLFDLAAELGVGSGSLVLDVGSGNGRHTAELARRLGCRVVGVEFVWDHLASGFPEFEAIRAAEPGVAGRIARVQGTINGLPFLDDRFDLVWARDMLIHISDLRGALAECRRVLGPRGSVLIFQMFATPWLEPAEAARLWPALATVPANTEPAYFERCVTEAGLAISRTEELRSEWRESLEESGSGHTSQQLLHAARLIRDAERFRDELGSVNYEVELADSLWGVYQMIGKLSPRVYVLRRRA
jgi:ubiquinone/menaquinone biosynthesis C-methylase UbiE